MSSFVDSAPSPMACKRHEEEVGETPDSQQQQQQQQWQERVSGQKLVQ